MPREPRADRAQQLLLFVVLGALYHRCPKVDAPANRARQAHKLPYREGLGVQTKPLIERRSRENADERDDDPVRNEKQHRGAFPNDPEHQQVERAHREDIQPGTDHGFRAVVLAEERPARGVKRVDPKAAALEARPKVVRDLVEGDMHIHVKILDHHAEGDQDEADDQLEDGHPGVEVVRLAEVVEQHPLLETAAQRKRDARAAEE
mmetsp:Transcript_1779/g.5446  ORF Transcript_1779/g.5446 Transcript_1779/m.5446 type:complete len:206 (+) Transcript_1779:146-763(+)